MLLNEILDSDEMKELLTSFNKVSTLHPRKEPNIDVQEIKETVQNLATLAKANESEQIRANPGTYWPKTFCQF